MAHCSMMERNTNTVEPMTSLYLHPKISTLSSFQDDIDMLHIPNTQASSLISQYKKMGWRQKLRAYDSDDMFIYILVMNRIQELSKFIKTVNRRDLYEELSREKLRQPYLQLMAVHHIMTGPERYTDDQLSPILEPIYESDQAVDVVIRKMFADYTPKEAYDVIHSVYGRFPDTMGSVLLLYSIVLLKDQKLLCIYQEPSEKEMKNVLSVVKSVVVGIGVDLSRILSQLYDYFVINPTNFLHECYCPFNILVIYHELYTLQHSLPGSDAGLHEIRNMIIDIKNNDNIWHDLKDESYFYIMTLLQKTSPVQCISIINEIFSFDPALSCYIKMVLAEYLNQKQSIDTLKSLELKTLVLLLEVDSTLPSLDCDIYVDIINCVIFSLQSDMEAHDLESTTSTLHKITSLTEHKYIDEETRASINLLVYHIVAVKKPQWLTHVSRYLMDTARYRDLKLKVLRFYLECYVSEQEPIAQMEWIHNHYSEHAPVVDAMLKVTVCGKLLSKGKTEKIRKILPVYSKSLCYRRFLHLEDKTYLKIALTVFLIAQQDSNSDHTNNCHKRDIFHWKWEANKTTIQFIKQDILMMYEHTQLPLENVYLLLVKLQEQVMFQDVRTLLDDIIQLIVYTLKKRTIAKLVLFLNMTKLGLVSNTLTESFAPFLRIDGNFHHIDFFHLNRSDVIYKCFLCLRHYNKMDRVDEDAIHEYREQFPFITAREKEDQIEKLVRLITIVVLLILLLISPALGLTSSQLKKYLALKYEYEDSLLYLLWCSGDVEINPGPTLPMLKKVPDSQKKRKWIYDMSTITLKTIHGHDLEVKKDGLWKEPPKNWDTRQPFYDPRNKPKGSNYKLEDDISLLKNLLEFLKQIGKQLPQPFNEEVMLWRNGNKQELFQHYLLRTFEKKDITKATAALRPYSCDERLKEQLEIRNIGIVLGQAGTNKPIKNYPDVVRDIATTLCRVSKRLPITEKSDGIWKSPPPGWNSQDKYYSPCNAGKRNETDQDKQLVNNLINCCECQKIEIPSELQPMVKAWRSGNRDEVYKEYSIWANVCIIEHSLKYLEVEGSLNKPQVQQLLQELGISVSTETAKVNPSTLNDKPATKKRKRKATVTVHEGPKKKSAISNTVILLPACDKGHETSCDPTTTQTPYKNKDDETDNGLPADTTFVSHSANDKTQTNPNNLSDDDKNTNLGNQSRTRINDSSRFPSEVNSGRNLDGSAVPHDNTGSSDGAHVVMDTVDTSENVTMETSEQDAMDTEDPDRLQKELDDLNDNPPPDLDFVEKYLTLLRNCDSCNNEFDLLTEVPSKKSC